MVRFLSWIPERLPNSKEALHSLVYYVRGSGLSRSSFGPSSHQTTFHKTAGSLYQSYWLDKGSCSGQDSEFFQISKFNTSLLNFVWVHEKEVRKVAFKYCSSSVIYHVRVSVFTMKRDTWQLNRCLPNKALKLAKPLRQNNPRVYECKRSELRISEGGREFSLLRNVQTGSAAHTDFYSMGTRVLSRN